MIFQAHRSKTVLGFLIRFFSIGDYSHISMLLGGYVYEAHAIKGVIKTPVESWDDKCVVDKKEMILSHDILMEVKEWLEKQVGKKYDYIGIISFLFASLPPRRGYWYCSELATVTFAKALGKTDEIEMQKISPTLFWSILNLVL